MATLFHVYASLGTELALDELDPELPLCAASGLPGAGGRRQDVRRASVARGPPKLRRRRAFDGWLADAELEFVVGSRMRAAYII
jgi:hypothetical protein